MSRSYKHTPISKSSTSRVNKKQANKIARQKLKNVYYEIGDNAGYKSIVDSWNIADYKSYGQPTEWDNIIEYNKCYLWK